MSQDSGVLTGQLAPEPRPDIRPRSADEALRRRARAVIPGGMYGHQAAGPLPAAYPQFMREGRGARVWDVDGNEYVDLMCSYGPVVLGHRHPAVEAAAGAQASLADCQNGPGAAMVELAELLVGTVQHADWAMFAKNGTDATTACCTIARAHTGKSRILVAAGAYHGAAPWCTPRPAGVTPADRANLGYYTFNDLDSVRSAVRARAIVQHMVVASVPVLANIAQSACRTVATSSSARSTRTGPGPFWQSPSAACAVTAASTPGCWWPSTTGP